MSKPTTLELDIERLTVDDYRTIQAVMERLAADHRRLVQRIERAQQSEPDESRRIALCLNREAVTRYQRISDRAGREILELDGEL